MATPCPQGYTDVEFPSDTLNLMVAFGHAEWDPEDGVHKLTDAGRTWLDQWLSDIEHSA